MNPRELDACVNGCADAHQRLLGHLDQRLAVGALDTAAPSELPDWTVGHVLGHMVGNAEAFTRVMKAAANGEVGEMYPDGREGRWARIEELAALDAESLVSRVRLSIWTLEGSWASCTADGWRSAASAFSGEFAVADVPFRRWREVEVHRTDLGWGYPPTEWDSGLVSRALAIHTATWLKLNAATELPAPAMGLTPGDRLAWLLGRVQPPGLPAGLTL